MTTGNDPLAGAEHPNSLGRGGEDFYALREYVVGDDLRRVHWPSTARHDDLMVRQDELPWQGRATVLVDVRASTNTADSLELVISAAASIVASSARRQDLVRLVSTDGADSGFAAGHAHIEAIMEHLASVEATNEAAFQRVLDRLARGAPGGALVVVVALVGQAELERLARLRPRFGSLSIVQFDRSSWDPSAPPTASAPTGPACCRSPARHPSPRPGTAPPARPDGHRAGGGRPAKTPVTAAPTGAELRPGQRRRLGPLGEVPPVTDEDERSDAGSVRRPRAPDSTADAGPPSAPGGAGPPDLGRVVPRLRHAGRDRVVQPGVQRRLVRRSAHRDGRTPAHRARPGPPARPRAPPGQRAEPRRLRASWPAGCCSVPPPACCCRHPTRSTPPAPPCSPRGTRSSRSSHRRRPGPGFMLVAAFAICFAVFLADWAAFRLWAPIEALVPTLTLFGFTAFVGSTRLQVFATTLYASMALLFVLEHRVAQRERSTTWLANDVERGSSWLVHAGVVATSVRDPRRGVRGTAPAGRRPAGRPPLARRPGRQQRPRHDQPARRHPEQAEQAVRTTRCSSSPAPGRPTGA